MASHAAQEKGARIVDFARDPPAVAFFRGSRSFRQSALRLESGLPQPQWLEDLLVGKPIERFAADFLHQLPENDITDVAVDEFCSGLRGGSEPIDLFQGSLFARAVVVNRIIVDKAGGVQEKLFNRDLLLAVLAELGKVFGDSIRQ